MGLKNETAHIAQIFGLCELFETLLALAETHCLSAMHSLAGRALFVSGEIFYIRWEYSMGFQVWPR